MIKDIVIEVESRSDRGKNAARRLRQNGLVPGIVYGMAKPPFSVSANPKRLEEILHLESGRNTIFKLALAGADQTRSVMIRDLQRDPVTDRMVHVDFVRVDLEKPVKVNVPIRITGVAYGVKTEGGVLEMVTRQIEVECLPADIPEHFDLDVTEMHIGKHASVKDVPVGDKVRVLTDPEAFVVVVAAPRAEETATPEGAAAAAPAEPEVIKKGKETPAAEPTKDKDKK